MPASSGRRALPSAQPRGVEWSEHRRGMRWRTEPPWGANASYGWFFERSNDDDAVDLPLPQETRTLRHEHTSRPHSTIPVQHVRPKVAAWEPSDPSRAPEWLRPYWPAADQPQPHTHAEDKDGALSEGQSILLEEGSSRRSIGRRERERRRRLIAEARAARVEAMVKGDLAAEMAAKAELNTHARAGRLVSPQISPRSPYFASKWAPAPMPPSIASFPRSSPSTGELSARTFRRAHPSAAPRWIGHDGTTSGCRSASPTSYQQQHASRPPYTHHQQHRQPPHRHHAEMTSRRPSPALKRGAVVPPTTSPTSTWSERATPRRRLAPTGGSVGGSGIAQRTLSIDSTE